MSGNFRCHMCGYLFGEHARGEEDGLCFLCAPKSHQKYQADERPSYDGPEIIGRRASDEEAANFRARNQLFYGKKPP